MRYLAFVFVLLAAGCGDSSTSPSTGVTATTTQYFSGTVDVQGTSFTAVSVAQPGTLSVTLTSVSVGTGVTIPASPLTMGLSVGVASADGLSCTVSSTISAAPGLTAQLTAQAVAGTSCVQISDVGNLTGSTNFIIRVVHT